MEENGYSKAQNIEMDIGLVYWYVTLYWNA
jgi:hypothetical protein